MFSGVAHELTAYRERNNECPASIELLKCSLATNRVKGDDGRPTPWERDVRNVVFRNGEGDTHRDLEKAGRVHVDIDDLYRQFGAELYRYAFALTGDGEAAKDVLQETMVGAWVARNSFRGESSLRTWLYGICRNKVRDHFRGFERRHENRFGSKALTGEDPVAAREPTGESKTGGTGCLEDDVIEKSVFWQAFRKLPVAHQEALLLVFYGGFSQAEVAAILKIPVDTVRSRVYHGRKKLASLLEDEDARARPKAHRKEGGDEEHGAGSQGRRTRRPAHELPTNK